MPPAEASAIIMTVKPAANRVARLHPLSVGAKTLPWHLLKSEPKRFGSNMACAAQTLQLRAQDESYAVSACSQAGQQPSHGWLILCQTWLGGRARCIAVTVNLCIQARSLQLQLARVTSQSAPNSQFKLALGDMLTCRRARTQIVPLGPVHTAVLATPLGRLRPRTHYHGEAHWNQGAETVFESRQLPWMQQVACQMHKQNLQPTPPKIRPAAGCRQNGILTRLCSPPDPLWQQGPSIC